MMKFILVIIVKNHLLPYPNYELQPHTAGNKKASKQIQVQGKIQIRNAPFSQGKNTKR